VARVRKHAAKDELHGRRARPDRVYRGEALEPQQEDSRNTAIKCAKVQTLTRTTEKAVADGVRFELTVPLQVRRISSAVPSTTRPPVRHLQGAIKQAPP
jgi:hypothetical protein